MRVAFLCGCAAFGVAETGLAAKMTVGGQTVRLDGGKFVFGGALAAGGSSDLPVTLRRHGGVWIWAAGRADAADRVDASGLRRWKERGGYRPIPETPRCDYSSSGARRRADAGLSARVAAAGERKAGPR